MSDKPIAVTMSDLHWSLKPPLLRSQEISWLDTQKDYMQQVAAFRSGLLAPIIAAGDITHRFDEGPEFINWLLDYHPEIYAIPGQHDLPYHNYGNIHKSVYWTLVKTGRIHNLEPGVATPVAAMGEFGKLVLYGFPYGFPITQCPKHKLGTLHVAVIHKYCYIKDHHYQDAPEKFRLKNLIQKLKGYDACVFGDNHKNWLYKDRIINNGTLMRRRADEVDFKPRVGILHESGKFTRKRLDISGDRLIQSNKLKDMAESLDMDLDAFVSEVEELQEKGNLDLEETVKQFCEEQEVSNLVRAFLIDALMKRRK